MVWKDNNPWFNGVSHDKMAALLSFNERAVFIFKELEEMDTAEVAKILGCREVTVRSHLHRAKMKLKQHFQDFREALWTD